MIKNFLQSSHQEMKKKDHSRISKVIYMHDSTYSTWDEGVAKGTLLLWALKGNIEENYLYTSLINRDKG